MRNITLCCTIILYCSNCLHGQATRPASRWDQMVSQFASAVSQSDTATLASLLADDVCVQPFGNGAADVLTLLSRTQGTTVIAAKAYLHPTPQMATDIAQAVAASTLPDDIKRYMTPQTEAKTAKANEAASRWLGETLTAKPGDLVGVLVLWSHPTKRPETQQLPRPEMIFVLVKAATTELGPRITTIAYGNPGRQPVGSN